MSYSEMSDHKINVLVAKAIDGNADESYPLYRHLEVFDPCNSWADAGPIIEENKIDIIWYSGEQCWGAHKGMKCAYDLSPTRAAMTVFLMTQEKPDAA